jgi:uncharacterized protein (TIGR03663 family)
MIEQTEKQEESERATLNDRMWLICGIMISSIAALVRFYELGIKPLHHDEGVNGFFLTTLFRDGVYKYDPANYHGPTLYYIALAFAKIFGLETVPIRASVAIFGVLTVALTLYLKKYIGSIGSLAAALFIALSPGLVFISRYFIHETFFVFLSLGLVICILLFIEKRPAGIAAITWIALILLVCFLPTTLNLAKVIGRNNENAVLALRGTFVIIEGVLVFLVVRMLAAWNDGRPIYLLIASACASLLFATKETAFITIGVLAIACGCVWLWRRFYSQFVYDVGSDDLAAEPLTLASFWSGLGTSGDKLLILAAVILLFIYLFILFFSSFFTYWEGVKGAFEAYTLWTKTGSKDHTQNGMWAYFRWGLFDRERGVALEAPLFILSALGAVIALAKAKHRFALFAAFWAFGMLAAYTLIPYKTPWLALSFLMPMCIIAGYGINELFTSRIVPLRLTAVLLGVAAVGFLGYQTYVLNFVRYDDNDMPYVYAHTKREFLGLIGKIKDYSERSGLGEDATIQIVSPDYWPMVWYLKDYPHANFFGHMVDASNAEIIIAKKDDQDAEVIRKFSANYDYVGTYSLRPGVDLVLLVRKDIVGPEGLPLYKIEEEHVR